MIVPLRSPLRRLLTDPGLNERYDSAEVPTTEVS